MFHPVSSCPGIKQLTSVSRWPRPPCLGLVLKVSAMSGNTLGRGDSCRLAHDTKNGAMPQGQSETVPLPNFVVMEGNNQDSWGLQPPPGYRSRVYRQYRDPGGCCPPAPKERKTPQQVWRLSWMERLWDKSPIALVLGMTPGVSSSLTRLLRRPPCRFVALTSVSQPYTFFIGSGRAYFSAACERVYAWKSDAISARRAPRRSTSARILSSAIPSSLKTSAALGIAFCSGSTTT